MRDGIPQVVAMERAAPTGLSSTGSGVFWMVLSCALLAGVAALGRYVALEGVPTFQTVFLRLAFAILAFAPLLMVRGTELLHTEHLNLYILRVFVGLFGMTTWFAALSYIPVGELTAIGFLAPIFGTVGAVFLLREVVGWRRWSATLVGLLGALVILRPGVNDLDIGTWLAIAAAFGMAMAGLLVKNLTGKDDPDKVVLIALCLQAPVALIPAIIVWQPISLETWGVYAVMGLCGMLGHITLTRAFRAADASVVMSLEFARLPFAVLYGFAMFGELIDLWTWAGAGIIFAAALYTAHRERVRRRTEPAPIRE
ncbi:MAG: DMT family transporter [Pseudomonadota bacterium]